MQPHACLPVVQHGANTWQMRLQERKLHAAACDGHPQQPPQSKLHLSSETSSVTGGNAVPAGSPTTTTHPQTDPPQQAGPPEGTPDPRATVSPDSQTSGPQSKLCVTLDDIEIPDLADHG